MAISPYLIRIGVPEEDAIVARDGDPFACNDIMLPVNDLMKNEMTCMIFKAKDESEDIGYHAHFSGTETFLCLKGKVEILSQGQRSYMVPGDILHSQPFMGHAFKAVEPNTWLAVLFQGMNMIGLMEQKFYVFGKFPKKYKEDEAFHESFNRYANKIDRACKNPVDTDPDHVFALRRPGKGRKFAFNGITLYEKVGRHEVTGDREFWEADVKKGAKLHFDGLFPAWRLFLVNKGSVKVQVYGEEAFVAEGKDHALIRIPPFHPFTMEMLDDSNYYDLDCPDMLGSLMEEIDPSTTAEEYAKLAKRFGCTLTKFEYEA